MFFLTATCSICGEKLETDISSADGWQTLRILPCQRCLETARLEGGNEALQKAIELCGCGNKGKECDG